MKEQPLSVTLPPVSKDMISYPPMNMKKNKGGVWKIIGFFKNYFKLFKLVFQSIIPDLRSFKWWQGLLLLLFAAFVVVFTVLVIEMFFLSLHKSLFYLPRISIHFFLKYLNDRY